MSVKKTQDFSPEICNQEANRPIHNCMKSRSPLSGPQFPHGSSRDHSPHVTRTGPTLEHGASLLVPLPTLSHLRAQRFLSVAPLCPQPWEVIDSHPEWSGAKAEAASLIKTEHRPGEASRILKFHSGPEKITCNDKGDPRRVAHAWLSSVAPTRHRCLFLC